METYTSRVTKQTRHEFECQTRFDILLQGGRSPHWNCLIVFTIGAARWQQFTRSEFVIIFLCIYNGYLEWEWSYLASCECITWGCIKGARLNNLAQQPSSTVRELLTRENSVLIEPLPRELRGIPRCSAVTQFLFLNYCDVIHVI